MINMLRALIEKVSREMETLRKKSKQVLESKNTKYYNTNEEFLSWAHQQTRQDWEDYSDSEDMSIETLKLKKRIKKFRRP